jgi:hypothetical protein
MIKSLCVAASLVLAIVLFGAAPASASTFHIKSCLKEGKECKTSSVGTTIEAKSEMTFEKEETLEDKCILTLTAKVTDPTTEKAGDDMALSIFKAAFTECSGSAIEVTGLPWEINADAKEFEETGAMEIWPFEFKTFFLGCEYEAKIAPEADTLLSYFVNAPSYWLTLDVGHVKDRTGNPFCWLLKLRYDDVVPLLNDPKYTSANTVVVG